MKGTNVDTKPYDVLVIGAGPAGVTAALRANELGAHVALVEGAQPGGTAANDGVVPTRTLAYAARLLRQARQFQSFGLLAAAPELDFASVLAHAQQNVYHLHEQKQLIERLSAAGADVLTGVGTASFGDPDTLILSDGRRLSARRFIIATGGHSRQILFPGSEFALTHVDLWRLKVLPTSLTIFGGAATGCQVASILNDFGVAITLVQRGSRLLEREDPLVSETMDTIFRRRGINVITGLDTITGVVALPEGGYRVSIQHETGPMSWNTGAVLSAVGWAANAEPLKLENAGVTLERGYIKVNDYQQTSAPHIYAAGDITGRMMLVQSAAYEGRVAAENAVLGNGLPYRHEIVPHGGFTDPEYAGVGLTESDVPTDTPVVAVSVPYSDLDRAVIDGHTDGFFKLVVSQDTHRVLGASAVGEQALEIIQVVAAAMSADMWVEQLAELELAYPTYTAILGLAARRAMYALGVMPIHPSRRSPTGQPLSEWERGG
jgi:pyruvate/2-oxoglutarate dehydrogenase complex dihydrolipoamide dehydrogenase (E3) component